MNEPVASSPCIVESSLAVRLLSFVHRWLALVCVASHEVIPFLFIEAYSIIEKALEKLPVALLLVNRSFKEIYGECLTTLPRKDMNSFFSKSSLGPKSLRAFRIWAAPSV